MNNQIPEFIKELLKNQYDENTAKSIIDGYTKKRLVTIRVNTIKSNKEEVISFLKDNNLSYEEVKILPDALCLKGVTSKEILDTTFCKEGKIYLQSLSSQLPAYLLSPSNNEDIIDMCAAPGSKTTYLAALTNNEGRITACEVDKIRLDRLKANALRLGASCISFMKTDSRRLDDFFRFDKILLDAPCSGSGTLSVFDKSIAKFSSLLVKNSSRLQTELLTKALTILKPGHEMIYSTCSILKEENEDVVRKVMKKFNVEVVPFKNEVYASLPLLETTLPGALLIKPNEYYEGFFVVKLKRSL